MFMAPSLPPGPRAPAFWQLLRYAHSPLTFLEHCSRRYGDPFTVRCGGFGTIVFMTDVEAIRDVFRGDPLVLHSGEGNEFLSVSVGKNSVLVLDDEAHAEQRRVLVPPLKGERMRAFFNDIVSEARTTIKAWPTGKPLRMLPQMRRITVRVILQAALGLQLGPELDDLERKVERVAAYGRPNRYSIVMLKLVPVKLFANSRWLPFFRQLRQLDETLFALIERRRRELEQKRNDNVLDDLLAAAHENGRPVSDQEIRDAIITLLLAGFDTTSIALSWALEQIVPRPDVVDRIGDELKQVAGGGELLPEHLERLTYLDAAIRESMRLRTIIPFVVRKTKKAFTAGRRDYPPGVLLAPCSHLVHRRADLYPEPEKFRPERFLERKFAPHEWFPFGGGNRVCLGMTFALYEMKIVLATIFGQWRLRRPDGARSKSVRQGISLGPHDGVRMVAE
jgi:cytochrome P450